MAKGEWKMINVIKGILYRMINNIPYLIMPLVITPVVIAAAIFFSSSFIAKTNVGVVGDNINFNSNEVNIIRLENNVPLSDLVKNKYDAVVFYENGKKKVETIKDDNFKNKIEKIVRGENVTIKDGEKRGVSSNIIGYITMFILLEGVLLYKFFFDDKKGIAKRVISANISYEQYVLSHLISVFIMIFVPTVIITILSKELLGFDTRVTTMELAFIVLILSLLGSAFGLIIASITRDMDSAGMLGNMISIITTLFAGSFFTISNNNIVNIIANIMPQKHILNFTVALENENGLSYSDLLIVVFSSIAMIICSFLINKYKIRRFN